MKSVFKWISIGPSHRSATVRSDSKSHLLKYPWDLMIKGYSIVINKLKVVKIAVSVDNCFQIGPYQRIRGIIGCKVKGKEESNQIIQSEQQKTQ